MWSAAPARLSSAAVVKSFENKASTTRSRIATSSQFAPPQPANLTNMKTFKSTAFKLGVPESEHNRLVNSLAYFMEIAVRESDTI